MIRDALLTRHRLPRCGAGSRPARWSPTRPACSPRPSSDAPVTSPTTSTATSPRSPTRSAGSPSSGPIDEAMLRLYPEQREAEQLEALDRRFATLHVDSINHVGDRRHGAARRLEGPARLRPDAVPGGRRPRRAGRGRWPGARQPRRTPLARGRRAGRPRRRAGPLCPARTPRPRPSGTAGLTITDGNLGGDPVARNTTTGRAVIEQAVREWCGRTDTHLEVLPVLDLAGHDATDAYRPKDATVRPRRPGGPALRLPALHAGRRPRATTTTSSPTTTTTRRAAAPRATATSRRCADITTSSRPTPGGATRSSTPACGSGPTRTASSSSATAIGTIDVTRRPTMSTAGVTGRGRPVGSHGDPHAVDDQQQPEQREERGRAVLDDVLGQLLAQQLRRPRWPGRRPRPCPRSSRPTSRASPPGWPA